MLPIHECLVRIRLGWQWYGPAVGGEVINNVEDVFVAKC